MARNKPIVFASLEFNWGELVKNAEARFHHPIEKLPFFGKDFAERWLENGSMLAFFDVSLLKSAQREVEGTLYLCALVQVALETLYEAAKGDERAADNLNELMKSHQFALQRKQVEKLDKALKAREFHYRHSFDPAT